ncbi:MAG: hypothetical protein V2G51_03365 [bacterium JZ-2024 1]
MATRFTERFGIIAILRLQPEPHKKWGRMEGNEKKVFCGPVFCLMVAGALAALSRAGCTPYAVGEASAVTPDRVWTIYEGKTTDELSARVASVFSPAENTGDRIRIFSSAAGFFVFIQPQVMTLYSKNPPPENPWVWYLPTTPDGVEWKREIECPGGGLVVTSPLTFLGDYESDYYFLMRCLRGNHATGTRESNKKEKVTDWIVRFSPGMAEPAWQAAGDPGRLWTAWLHQGYLFRAESEPDLTIVKGERLSDGKQVSFRISGQWGRGWLGRNTASEIMVGEDGLALLKQTADGWSAEPIPGATGAKLGRCGSSSVYARLDGSQILLLCLISGKLAVATADASSLEAARTEVLTSVAEWTDPSYPPEDLAFYEVPARKMLVVTTGRQVIGIDRDTGGVRYALIGRTAGVFADRVSIFDTRPPGRLYVRHHEVVSGKILSSLQSNLQQESLSVLSLLTPVRSGISIFNLATGRILYIRSSNLPSEVTGVTRVQ